MSLDLLDWRRRVHRLYAEVRANPDPAEAHAHWAATRTELLLTHSQSPIREPARAGAVIEHAPYDPAFRREAELEPAEPETREVPTGTDGVVVLERIGRLSLGDLGRLDVWWLRGYGGGLFVPVADPHEQTYGGGRYVLDTVKGADLGPGTSGPESLVVDLNFAYNPSCTYDPAWACPLAPAGNRLEVPLPVGEMLPTL